MKRITSFEIRCLKELLKIYRDQNIMLRIENDELRKQLAESRAKEGKGCLETAIEGLAKAFASLDFTSMVSAQIESAHCNILDADCPDDCDFDCEHCEHARIDIEEG